jgi:hypothetical protein
VAHRFATLPGANQETVLNTIAAERYGAKAAPHARKAWTAFSDGFRRFPYCGSVLYFGPQQMGPSNLLYEKPTGYASTMVGIPYDDLEGWRGLYPPTVFAEQFEKVAQGWAGGLLHFQRAVDATPSEHRKTAASDLSVARAAYLHFASIANQVRFVMARDALSQPNVSDEQRLQLRRRVQQIIKSEITLARDLYVVASQDSRIGYEASNHYFYLPQDLVEKVINCELLKRKFSE